MNRAATLAKVSAWVAALTVVASAQAAVIVEGDLGADQEANGWRALNNEAGAGTGNGFYNGGSYQYPLAGSTGEDPLALVRDFSGTEEFEIEDYNDLLLEWRDFAGAGGARFAVKVEGIWYFSNTNHVGNSDGTRDSLAFSLTAADWTSFTIGAADSVDELVVGSVAGSDLSGTVQGFGLFDQASDGDGGNDFDYIAISGTLIPEPGSFVIVSLGGLVLSMRKGRPS